MTNNGNRGFIMREKYASLIYGVAMREGNESVGSLLMALMSVLEGRNGAIASESLEPFAFATFEVICSDIYRDMENYNRAISKASRRSCKHGEAEETSNN